MSQKTRISQSLKPNMGACYNLFMANLGRPEFSDDTYRAWLEDMKPFLQAGNTLSRAIEKAGLAKHRTTLYEKARLNDWFSDKIHAYQSYLGELVNEISARQIRRIYDYVIRGRPLSRTDCRIFCFVATHHRSCAPFFVQRHEIAVKHEVRFQQTHEIPEINYIKPLQTV